MIVQNPLVPPVPASPGGGSPAPVANAPQAEDKAAEAETDRPVTSAKEPERSDGEDRRQPAEEPARERGSRVDITV